MSSTSIRSHMRADHEQLAVWLEELLAAFESGDREAAAEAYGKFESRLAEHLALEEDMLFPELERSEPEEVAALRNEHTEIRAKLFELGVGVDLHLTRLPAIKALAAMLRTHAAREDGMLYEWADRVFSDPERWLQLDTYFTHGRSPAPPVL